jgi:hypothetical protein
MNVVITGTFDTNAVMAGFIDARTPGIGNADARNRPRHERADRCAP